MIRRCPRREGRREGEISGPTSAVVLVRILRARDADAEPTLDFRVRCLVRPDVEARPTRSLMSPFASVAIQRCSWLMPTISGWDPLSRRGIRDNVGIIPTSA